LLEKLARDGHGGAVILKSRKRLETTVAKVLANAEIMAINDSAGKIMMENRQQLKRDMDLDENDLIDLPVIFFKAKGRPLWPNPVNGLVVGSHFIASKPFGPMVNGSDAIEEACRDAFAGTGAILHFIDVYDAYSRRGGEIHCGTNTIRHRTRY
jgi:protein-arginine deiminase